MRHNLLDTLLAYIRKHESYGKFEDFFTKPKGKGSKYFATIWESLTEDIQETDHTPEEMEASRRWFLLGYYAGAKRQVHSDVTVLDQQYKSLSERQSRIEEIGKNEKLSLRLRPY